MVSYEGKLRKIFPPGHGHIGREDGKGRTYGMEGKRVYGIEEGKGTRINKNQP